MEGGPRIEAEKVTRIELGPEIKVDELMVTVYAPFGSNSQREIGSGYSLGKNPCHVEYMVTKRGSQNPEKVALDVKIEGRTAVVTGDLRSHHVQNIGPFEQGEEDAHCLELVVPYPWIRINDNGK